MDRLEALRLFVRLAELGSFSAAARELKIKQSTASKWIAELESGLGVNLVERTTRAVRVTEAGQRLLAHVGQVLAAFDELRAEFEAHDPEPRGHLRVTVPVVFGRLFVVPAIADFLKLYREVSIELVMNDRYVKLVDEGFDLAVRVGIPVDTSDRGRKLAETRRVLVAAPSYLKMRGRPTEPRDLRQHECLVHGEIDGPALWRFEKEGAKGVPVSVRGRFAANNSEAVATMARRGLGIALLADWLVEEDLARGKLVALLEDFAAPPAPVYALTPRGRFAPTAVRLLGEHLGSVLSARLHSARST